MTLTEFVEARLAEDEAAAKAGRLTVPAPDGYTGPTRHLSASLPDPVQARVLREVDAKRKILDEHAGYPPEQPTCAVCHSGGWDWDPERWPCTTVRALAAAWSDHPDYDEAWRP